MNNLARYFLGSTIILFLNGCAAPAGNGPPFNYIEPSFNNGKSYITHFRVGAGRGGGITAFLYGNGKYITKIMYEGYYTEEVTPGRITYKIIKHREGLATALPLISAAEFALRNEREQATTALTLDVGANREYFISWRIDVDKRTLVPVIVSKEQALKMLTGLREFDFSGEVPNVE